MIGLHGKCRSLTIKKNNRYSNQIIEGEIAVVVLSTGIAAEVVKR